MKSVSSVWKKAMLVPMLAGLVFAGMSVGYASASILFQCKNHQSDWNGVENF